MTWKKQ